MVEVELSALLTVNDPLTAVDLIKRRFELVEHAIDTIQSHHKCKTDARIKISIADLGYWQVERADISVLVVKALFMSEDC